MKIHLKKTYKFIIICLSSLMSVSLIFYPNWQQLTFASYFKNYQSAESVEPSDQHGSSENINARTRLTSGIRLYESRQYRGAIASLQAAITLYQMNGDRLGEALTRVYLAKVYQELAEWEAAKQEISTSLVLLEQQEESTKPTLVILSQALNTWGSIQLATGDISGALESWENAETIYSLIEDLIGIIGSKINQVQALNQLGLYRRAQRILSTVHQTLEQMPPDPIKAIGLRSFGISLQVIGKLERAQTILEESLAIARQLEENQALKPEEISATLIALGNNARALQQPQVARAYYQEAAEMTSQPIEGVEAQLNELSLLVETQQWTEAIGLLPTIQSHLDNLPISRFSIYARINFASSLRKIAQRQPTLDRATLNDSEIDLNLVAQILAKAVQSAKILNDTRAESYALSQLGYLYEQANQWSDARQLTEQAIILAQGIQAIDIVATAQWQLGRILKQQGKTAEAIAAYTEAFHILQSLRSDLVATSSQLQFSFRDTIEPIYRELVALLLEASQSPGIPPGISDSENIDEQTAKKINRDRQKNLQQARKIIEALQLAELDNFFRNTCLQVREAQIDQVDSSAAVIYPMILPDRLAVILSLPGQPLRDYETNLPANQIETVLTDFWQSLNPVFNNEKRLQVAQQLYNWLIKPAEPDLIAGDIKTLVFVLDGSLRNLPMAALYDGQQYLVEKYSIALTPGLQLLDPQSLERKKLQVLSGGLTQPRQGFKALPGVELEVQEIASQLQSDIILDRDFTEINLESKIHQFSFPVVHLATHAQFSSNVDRTFILTWDGRINIQELNELLLPNRQKIASPIELLVLSACQTASGDRRATLGLAGVAVRSGARSTLATLWSVQDNSTAILMSEFYRAIANSKVSKAEALRRSQMALLHHSRFQHPFYWAPFVLIGNWL